MGDTLGALHVHHEEKSSMSNTLHPKLQEVAGAVEDDNYTICRVGYEVLVITCHLPDIDVNDRVLLQIVEAQDGSPVVLIGLRVYYKTELLSEEHHKLLLRDLSAQAVLSMRAIFIQKEASKR